MRAQKKEMKKKFGNIFGNKKDDKKEIVQIFRKRSKNIIDFLRNKIKKIMFQKKEDQPKTDREINENISLSDYSDDFGYKKYRCEIIEPYNIPEDDAEVLIGFDMPIKKVFIEKDYQFEGDLVYYRGVKRDANKIKWYQDSNNYCEDAEIDIFHIKQRKHRNCKISSKIRARRRYEFFKNCSLQKLEKIKLKRIE